MSLKIWLVLTFGFVIYSGSSAEVCTRSYVDGKWISEGDCEGQQMMSEIMKELQLKAEEEKKKKKKWTRRLNGDVDFYRGWDDYVNGFGNSEGDYWLGLDKLHEMTKEGNMQLVINMITNDTNTHWVAKYSNFQIGPSSDNYKLTVSGYSGNATRDTFSHYNNQQFSTKDSDHDNHISANCASLHEGGWWYSQCANSNLNGNFNKRGVTGIWWWGEFSKTKTGRRPLRYSEMKFRRRL